MACSGGQHHHRRSRPAGTTAAPAARSQGGHAKRRGGRLMATLAAVDLGAQSGRVALGRFDGERLSVTEVHRFPNVPVRTRGTLQWDVLRLYGGVLDALAALARDGPRVASVAVDSWAVEFGLLDRRGRLIQNPTHYRDARRASAVDGGIGRGPARE